VVLEKIAVFVSLSLDAWQSKSTLYDQKI